MSLTSKMISKTIIIKKNTDIILVAYDSSTLYLYIITNLVIYFVPCVDMLEEENKNDLKIIKKKG